MNEEREGKCCEKCDNGDIYHSCTNGDCPCHNEEEVQESMKASMKESREGEVQESRTRIRIIDLGEVRAEARTLALQEAAAIVKAVKDRYRCAACDGAKCAHTLGCNALNDAAREIKRLARW